MGHDRGCCGANRGRVCLFGGRPGSYDFRIANRKPAMPRLTLDPPPAAIALQPGDSFRTALDPASWIELEQGCARLVAPPSWFGETVFTATTLLEEGAVHRVERGGWIELQALAPVRLRIHAPRQAAAEAPARAQPRPVMRLVRLLTGS